jgi:sensor histidine kinase regulating citrate/malate metabolism
VSGLIQLKNYELATDLITKYSEVNSEFFSDLQNEISDSLTFALLFGKANRFAELGIKFTIFPGSSLSCLPGRFSSGDMVVVLGNLLENAMEAVRDTECPEIHIALREGADGLRIVVQNTGPWIPSELDIYKRGTSTKGLTRGIGLALVSEKIAASMGSIEHSNLADGGVEFRVFIPKNV